MNPKKQRKLKLWNGRWTYGPNRNCHAFVAAYSVNDAIELITDLLGYTPHGLRNEMRAYWSAGLWGNTMTGITPERGVWVTDERARPTQPVRLEKKA